MVSSRTKKRTQKKTQKRKEKRRRESDWVAPLSDKEVEEKIIEMKHHGATQAEIAHATHSAPLKVKTVWEEYKKTQVPRQESKRSAALGFLDEGRSSLSIARDLDLSFEEIEQFRLELMKLKGMDEYEKIYSKIGNLLTDLIDFYNSFQQHGLELDDLSELKDAVEQRRTLSTQNSGLVNDIRNAEFRLNKLIADMDRLEPIVANLNHDEKTLLKRKKYLNNQIARLESLVSSHASHPLYKAIERFIITELRNRLDAGTDLLEYALSSVILVLRNKPHLQRLLLGPSDYVQDPAMLHELIDNADPIMNHLRQKIEREALENIEDRAMIQAEREMRALDGQEEGE
jgi:hypothetical protein